MEKILAVFGVIVIIMIGLSALSLLMALPFMWMWNYAVVAALNVANTIGYWHAFCLMWFISLFLVASRSSSKSD